MKICNFCLLNKDINDFPKKGNRCKKCNSDYKKEYALKNKNKIKKQQKNWYKNNSDKVKERVKNYVLENEDKVKCYRKKYNSENYNGEYHHYYKLVNKGKIKEYKKEYYINNKHLFENKLKKENNKKIHIKLKNSVRNFILNAFKKCDVKKIRSIDDILGCNYDEFVIYLENRFRPNMSWNNYQLYWDLDYIVPISWIKTEEDIYNLNHYTNFQPKIWLETI